VDHPLRAQDDLANAACGALWLASKQPPDVLLIASDAAGGHHVNALHSHYDPYSDNGRLRQH
jgi:hypothetical protein